MTGDLLPMAGMGAITSVLAPGLLLATRGRPLWRRLSLPAAVVLPVFVLLHGTITVGMCMLSTGMVTDAVLHLLLLAGAVAFWLPVLGEASTLGPAGRSVYLFLAAPTLDLAGVLVVATGNTAGGLAMIVAMLPIGIAAVLICWRWIVAEELAVRAAERMEPAG
jgi:hypothetical protein